MKHIDNLHAGASGMLSSGMSTSSVNRNGETVKRKTVCLARNIHAIASEVAFREEMTLRQLLSNSLEEFIHAKNHQCRPFDYSNAPRPTVFLPRDVVSSVRVLAHDQKINERDIFSESLCRYVNKYFSEKYSDIAGINNL